MSDNEIYLLMYIKSVLWRVAKRLFYIEDARCLKVKQCYDVVVTSTTHGCHELVLEYVNSWLPHWGGESLSADGSECEMENRPGHSFALGRRVQGRLASFPCLVRRLRRYQSSGTLPSRFAAPTRQKSSCFSDSHALIAQWKRLVNGPGCQHFLRRDAGYFACNPHGDPTPAALVICPFTSWQPCRLIHLNCPENLVPLFDGGVYEFASGIW